MRIVAAGHTVAGGRIAAGGTVVRERFAAVLGIAVVPEVRPAPHLPEVVAVPVSKRLQINRHLLKHTRGGKCRILFLVSSVNEFHASS